MIKNLTKAVLIVLFALIFSSCQKEEGIAIRTSKVMKRTIVQTVSAIGRIEPETEVNIKPEANGELIELNVKEGDSVKMGQILAKIEPDIIETQLEQSKASANAAKMDIDFNKATMEQAKAQFDRIKELYEDKFSSLQELEQAKSTFEQTTSRYKSSLANYERALASLKQIQRQEARTTIISPMDGIVTTLNIEEGEKVQGIGTFQGTEMLTISDLSVINAKVEVDENDVVNLQLGDTARIEIDAFPDKKFNGYVIEIGHSAKLSATGSQDQTTNFDVKIRMIDEENRIRPGMSCSVKIETETRENTLAIPLQAVTVRNTQFGGGKAQKGGLTDRRGEGSRRKPDPVVFLKDGDKAKLQKVKVGISDRGFIEVLEGLEENQEIISGPYAAVSKDLNDGTLIRTEEQGEGKKKWGGRKDGQ